MADDDHGRPLAVVTGASSGIGFHIAGQLAANGFDLVIVADESEIDDAAASLRRSGTRVEPLQIDLATAHGVEELVGAVVDRDVEVLVANAGVVVNGAFVDTDLDDHLSLIALNVTGIVQLTHAIAGAMAGRGRGRLLITSSIAALMPGPNQSTYSASKAFLHIFAEGLRGELAKRGVTVTSLLPGPTDTRFFERGGMEDTKLAQFAKGDPVDVARAAVQALLDGDDQVVPGLANKVQRAAAAVGPDRAIATLLGKLAEPGSGR